MKLYLQTVWQTFAQTAFKILQLKQKYLPEQ